MRKTIIDMPLKKNPSSVRDKITDKNDDPFVLVEYTEKIEKRSKIGLKVANFIRYTIVCSLDLLLMIAILPYIFYQWACKNERSIIILKAIIEIILEAIMWLIFAGVSILVTVAFVMEELYFSGSGKNLKLSIDVPNDVDNLQTSKKKEQSEYRS